MGKKIISIIITACLILSCFATVSFASAQVQYEKPQGVILNAQFAEGNNGGFELLSAKTGAAVTTVPESEGSDNYVLKYTATNHSAGATSANGGAEHIEVKVGGEQGIEFVEGRNIIIETKFRKTNAATRVYLKYNMYPKDNYKEETANLYSLVALWHDGGVRYANGSSGTGSNLDQVSMKVSELECGTDYLTAKIVIKGTSLLADVYLTDEEGNTQTIENVSLKQPVDRTSLDPSDAMYIKEATHLKTLSFRTRSGGTTSATDVIVDYLKVTQELTYTSTLDKNIVGEDENIVVSMVTDATDLDDVSAFYDLYTAEGQLVASEKSFDKATKKLTINPAENLIAGNNYVVKVDNAGLLSELNYVYDTESEELSLSIVSCKAENVLIDGRLIDGEIIEGTYKYVSSFDKTGETYAWYAAPSIDGPWTVIDGQTSSSIEASTALANGQYLKMSVIPQSQIGAGIEAFSNILCPEAAPVADNLRLAEGNKFIGDTLVAEYDYFDANGDEDNGTVIKWYIGNTAESNEYEMISQSGSLRLLDEYEGKYIRFSVTPKNEIDNGDECVEVFGNPFGPVSNYLTGSNLFSDPGFETGTTEGIKGSTFPAELFEIVTKTDDSDGRVYSGDYSLYVGPRPENYSTWGKNVNYVPGKTYLLSGMVKSVTDASINDYEGYGGVADSILRPFRDEEKVTINNETWTRVTLTVVTNETASSGTFGLLTFSGQGKQAVYVDDMYFGELKITDIITEEIQPTVIPEKENIVIRVFKDKMLNQFGTTTGLEHEDADVEVLQGKGVEIDNNNCVVITPEAVAGEVVLRVSCTPETTTAPYFSKEVKFTLLPNTNVTPSVKNVVASGTVATGEVLSVNYDYHQVENKLNASTFKWFYQDTPTGTATYIPNATASTYTVASAYADKFIGCEVTPATNDGLTGNPVRSNILVKAVAPYATKLEVTGKFSVGETVTGKYIFGDYNNDTEGVSTYSWFMSDTLDGRYVPLSGETNKTLVLTEEMVGKYLKFAVVPTSNTRPYAGEMVFSQPYAGPAKPEARNITISNNGSLYVGSYDYFHQHGFKEKNTKYEWFVDGILVSTSAQYEVNFEGAKTVTFKVTPGCEGNPSTGNAVMASYTITGNLPQGGGTVSGGGFGGGGLSGGGFGGGSGGVAGGTSGGNTSGFTSGVQSINDAEGITPEVKPATDIDSHWSKSYMEEMSKRGIMTPDNEGKYNPDEIVGRGDMIKYLFKALKLTESEYTGEFSDVKAEDEFAGMLQTMVNNGTISKYDTFRPNDGISREELCKVLYISLDNAGKLESAAENKISAFADYSSISDWAKEYVNAIYQNGIMIGVSETLFAPAENVTKAQVATLLTRILNIIER
ncbi:MAG: S-layer homology domain-containing protein [Clostridia bacterium]|nr:S-layer homology domain-containing protein [Clostridia bacterium]